MSFAIKMLLENEAALTNTVLKWRVRLEAQDSGFSFLQHGFEFRTRYKVQPSVGAHIGGTKPQGCWVTIKLGFCFLHQLQLLNCYLKK